MVKIMVKFVRVGLGSGQILNQIAIEMMNQTSEYVPNWFIKSNKKCWTHVMHNDEAKCYWLDQKRSLRFFLYIEMEHSCHSSNGRYCNYANFCT